MKIPPTDAELEELYLSGKFGSSIELAKFIRDEYFKPAELERKKYLSIINTFRVHGFNPIPYKGALVYGAVYIESEMADLEFELSRLNKSKSNKEEHGLAMSKLKETIKKFNSHFGYKP